MITRVLAVGLLAGLIAGVSIAVMQAFTTTPLIIAAETYENAPHEHAFSASPHLVRAVAMAAPARIIPVHQVTGEDAHDAWTPADGWERTFYTSTATVGTAVGFAFLLLAGMLYAGGAITERRAMGWAAAAFAATGLAPAMGLPPELPGMDAAGLVDRQIWWIGTAVASAVALWLFLRSDAVALKILAIALLVLPHAIGAPHLAEAHASSVPADLAARFAATSLAVQASLWALTGFLVGILWPRIGEDHGG